MKEVLLTGAIRKLGRDEPTYFVEVGVSVDEKEIDRCWISCQAAELVSWAKLRLVIFVGTDVLPKMDVPPDSKLTSQSVWERLLGDLMEHVELVDAPPEASESGALYQRTLQWVAGRSLAKTSSEFGRGGKRFETADGRMHFRSTDLLKNLEQGMKVDRRVLWKTLEPIGFTASFARVIDKIFRTWSVPGETLARWIAENREGVAVELPEPNGTASAETVEDAVEALPF